MMPAQGLSDLTVNDLIINETGTVNDIAPSTTQVDLNRTITGASTLVVSCDDPLRGILKSQICAQASILAVDGLNFTLVQVSKTADTLSLTFEAQAVNRLRGCFGALAVAPKTATRTQFMQRLIATALGPPIPTMVWPGAPQIQETLARGTSQNANEDTWTCLTRLASEVQWRCFENAGTIWIGPDSWLLSLPPLGTLQEFTDGVDFIDFDFDIGKPNTTAQITVTASRWGFAPGEVVTLAGVGPANGNWIVSSIARSLYQAQATITVTQPTPALPEPVETTVAAGTTATAAAQSPGGSSASSQAVAFARSQLGVPYRYGAESPGVAFDCSGLTQDAYSHAGITIPRVAQAQFNQGPHVSGGLKVGDLVFFGGGPGSVTHVGIYVGGGQMVDAPHTGVDVRTESFPTSVGAHWGSDIYVGATRPAP